jgi:hypothetical protein
VPLVVLGLGAREDPQVEDGLVHARATSLADEIAVDGGGIAS